MEHPKTINNIIFFTKIDKPVDILAFISKMKTQHLNIKMLKEHADLKFFACKIPLP